MNTKKPTYNPQSYFFVDYTALVASEITDAYGPVSGYLEEKYRTTSFVRAQASNFVGPVVPAKVFAICDGQILIQPMAGSTDKVNLILKPSANYAPLKIKYFIYRGVRREDLFDQNNLKPINDNDANQPTLLKRIRKVFKRFNKVDDTAEFPAPLIGYDLSIPATTLIDEIFLTQEANNCQLPYCTAGTWLGNFTDRIGLDIVLDDGEYQLEHQKELFKFDLEYARQSENIFDLSSLNIQSLTDVQKKRYKEYILRFIDAAAFWGSHIECGSITLYDETSPTCETNISSSTNIYDNILDKYQTKHCVYIHVIAEKGRSYNYYNDERKVFFDNIGLLYIYETNDWPILKKEYTCTQQDYAKNKGMIIVGKLKYGEYAPTNLEHIITRNVIHPNLTRTSFPKEERTRYREIRPELYSLKAVINKDDSTKYDSCSTFIFVTCNFQQTDFNDYCNDLWKANIKPVITVSNTNDSLYCCTENRNALQNLNAILSAGVVMQNKVIFDTGEKTAGGITSFEKRRLYIASIQENTMPKEDSADFNVIPPRAFVLNKASYETYIQRLYGTDFSVCKDSFTDGVDTIQLLSLKHNNSFDKHKNYFQLGILEKEYSALIIKKTIVDELPVEENILLTNNADTVFFHLTLDTTFRFPSSAPSYEPHHISKYKLGIQYENNNGELKEKYPSGIDEIFVYTLDNCYFFSQGFAEYQHLYENYPQCNSRVDFRVIPEEYNGEFGFDWIREATTGANGDVNYFGYVGKAYNKYSYTELELDLNTYDVQFESKLIEYRKLEMEYKAYFVKNNSTLKKYFVPLLTIYSPFKAGGKDSEIDASLNREAKLQLKVVNTTAEQLCLQYDTNLLSICTDDGNPISEELPNGLNKITVTIKCKEALTKEQTIKVLNQHNQPAGMLRIAQNSRVLSKEIMLINVETGINYSTLNPPPFTAENFKSFLKKFLGQLLIYPKIQEKGYNAATDSGFTKYIETSSVHGQYINTKPEDGLLTYFNDSVFPQDPENINNPLKIFLFPNKGGVKGTNPLTLNEGLTAPAVQYNTILILYHTNPSVIVHELLHKLFLAHTFTNSEATHFAKHTFSPLRTDNIMDYSHIQEIQTGGRMAFPTISLYEWQGKIARQQLPKP